MQRFSGESYDVAVVIYNIHRPSSRRISSSDEIFRHSSAERHSLRLSTLTSTHTCLPFIFLVKDIYLDLRHVIVSEEYRSGQWPLSWVHSFQDTNILSRSGRHLAICILPVDTLLIYILIDLSITRSLVSFRVTTINLKIL